MTDAMTRRTFAGSIGASLGAGAAMQVRAAEAPPQPAAAKRWQNGASPWPLCLDTATIRPASLEEKIRIAAKAGFDAIEPWEGELHEYEQKGGSLTDLGKRIRDAGLFVPSVIGLWNAIPATREEFDKSLVDSRRRMRQAAAVGAEHIQVVPQPARPWQEFDTKWAADRYRDLLEIGLNEFRINPALVFVQFLPGCARMGQAAAIAIDADHPRARIIPDVFHMHITHSGFKGIRHLRGDFFAIFQFNDAPAAPAIDQLKDEHRVFPGDGILPLADILRDLLAIGYAGCISLELYNPDYWKRDLEGVAREGREKTLKVIELTVPATKSG
jgi:sugar phosphate isomerase/epimerase